MSTLPSLVPCFPFPFGPFGTSTIVYDVLRRESPVVRVRVPSGAEPWLVTRYVDIQQVHRDPRFSRDEAVRMGAALTADSVMDLEPGVLQNMDGESHLRLRRVFAPHYAQGLAENWARVIRNEAEEVISSLGPGRFFDLRADLFEPITSRCAEKIYGFTVPQGTTVLDLFFNPELMTQARRHLEDLLREGGAVTAGSYLDLLRKACRDGHISATELLSNLMVFVTVTFEAVGGPFLGGVFAMLRDRTSWEAAVADRSVLPNAVDEMLRCFPNGDGQFLRVVTENLLLGGVPLSRGDAVLAPVAAANMDPEIFPDPRRFDIRRSNSGKHLAFGSGKHQCMGWAIAKTWMKTVLDVMLSRMPSLCLAVQPEDVRFRPIPLLSIIESLPVRN